MSDEHQHDELAAEEAAFVARLRAVYAPEPMSPASRVTFREKLDARLARKARGWRAPLGAAIAAAAALALWLAFPGDLESPSTDPMIQTTSSTQTVEGGLFGLADSAADEIALDETVLPDDYAAIASLLLDDV